MMHTASSRRVAARRDALPVQFSCIYYLFVKSLVLENTAPEQSITCGLVALDIHDPLVQLGSVRGLLQFGNMALRILKQMSGTYKKRGDDAGQDEIKRKTEEVEHYWNWKLVDEKFRPSPMADVL